MRCKCMYYLKFSIVSVIWSEVYCALVVRFCPTSRVVHQIYRETTMETLETNEKPLIDRTVKQVEKRCGTRKTRPNQVWMLLEFKMVSLISQTRQTSQTVFFFFFLIPVTVQISSHLSVTPKNGYETIFQIKLKNFIKKHMINYKCSREEFISYKQRN